MGGKTSNPSEQPEKASKPQQPSNSRKGLPGKGLLEDAQGTSSKVGYYPQYQQVYEHNQKKFEALADGLKGKTELERLQHIDEWLGKTDLNVLDEEGKVIGTRKINSVCTIISILITVGKTTEKEASTRKAGQYDTYRDLTKHSWFSTMIEEAKINVAKKDAYESAISFYEVFELYQERIHATGRSIGASTLLELLSGFHGLEVPRHAHYLMGSIRKAKLKSVRALYEKSNTSAEFKAEVKTWFDGIREAKGRKKKEQFKKSLRKIGIVESDIIELSAMPSLKISSRTARNIWKVCERIY